MATSPVWIFYTIMFLFLVVRCYAADPDPLQDFCVADLNSSTTVNGFPCKPSSEVTSGDFFFDGFTREGNTSNIFGLSITPANVRSFPGLNTLGISMNRVDYAPGGLSPPHTHPRSSELGIVIQGKLLVGLVTTYNVFYSKVIGPGEVFIIPRGLVHFQKNVGEGKVLAFASFNSQWTGSVVSAHSLFGTTPSVPADVLAQTFQIDESIVNQIKSKFGS